jgi:hypothetical protein
MDPIPRNKSGAKGNKRLREDLNFQDDRRRERLQNDRRRVLLFEDSFGVVILEA